MKDHLTDVVANSRHAFSIDRNHDCYEYFHIECLLVADPEDVGEFCLILQAPAMEIIDEASDNIKLYHDEILLYNPDEFEDLINAAFEMFKGEFTPFISEGYRDAYHVPEEYTIDDLKHVLSICLEIGAWLLNENEYLGFIIDGI